MNRTATQPYTSMMSFTSVLEGGARELNLSRDQTRDRWTTFVTKGGIFAKEMDPDPDAMMQQFQDAKWTADRLDGRGGQH